jgi:hypothetical protein
MVKTGGFLVVALAVVVAWFLATAYTEAETNDWDAAHGEARNAAPAPTAEPFAVEYPFWFAGLCALGVAVVGSILVLLFVIAANPRS